MGGVVEDISYSLGVWVNPDGNRNVSYLNGNPDNRNFNLNDADNTWNDNTWFLGLS